jgi:uncharacterized protein (TIGR03437 family)
MQPATRYRHILASFLCCASLAFAQSTWQLVWSDEFNGASNSQPDPSKWTYDLGNNNGWGNSELETYTNQALNAHMDGLGNLDIHVSAAGTAYTSARLKTQGLFGTGPGRVEARIKLPYSQGIWPAFWMLGSNIATVGWPQCGEIDIMENIGKEPAINHGSLHGPGYSGANPITATYTLPGSGKFSDAFHTFAIEWTATSVAFFVDGTNYNTIRSTAIPAGTQWVFNNPFFILLNVAVGGNFPGVPDSTTVFPQDMLIDYVRVYQAAPVGVPAVQTAGLQNSASFTGVVAPGGLATVYGSGFSQVTANSAFDIAAGAFPASYSGTIVFVNGVASPLTYVSPTQLNFQIPAASITNSPVRFEVSTNGVLSNALTATLAGAAPSIFADSTGTAIVNWAGGPVCTAGGGACTLWGNGFGPKNTPQTDGALTTQATTVAACTLTIGGVGAIVDYCGTAPGQIIDQLNFHYPKGIAASGATVKATLQIGTATGTFTLPALY